MFPGDHDLSNEIVVRLAVVVGGLEVELADHRVGLPVLVQAKEVSNWNRLHDLVAIRVEFLAHLGQGRLLFDCALVTVTHSL